MKSQKVVALFFGLWLACCLAVVTALVGFHYISFNPISFFQPEQNTWVLHHVLSSECKCSQTVYKSLIERGPVSHSLEVVSLIEDNKNWMESLERSGFTVKKINLEDIEKEQILAVPFLQIFDQNRNTVYSGGYGQHYLRQTKDVLDLSIFNSLKNNKAVSSFPIFGCVTSQKYKNLLDPFKIKYAEVK